MRHGEFRYAALMCNSKNNFLPNSNRLSSNILLCKGQITKKHVCSILWLSLCVLLCPHGCVRFFFFYMLYISANQFTETHWEGKQTNIKQVLINDSNSVPPPPNCPSFSPFPPLSQAAYFSYNRKKLVFFLLCVCCMSVCCCLKRGHHPKVVQPDMMLMAASKGFKGLSLSAIWEAGHFISKELWFLI